MRTCGVCKGSGHDPASRPVIKWEKYTDDRGKERKRQITKAQGSGCLSCLGRGWK